MKERLEKFFWIESLEEFQKYSLAKFWKKPQGILPKKIEGNFLEILLRKFEESTEEISQKIRWSVSEETLEDINTEFER